MNDPWDVKSVRKSGQYMSCMKINGVPLLPPVLSRECREEMQYYKLLAREVEKRISILQPYLIESDTESSEDKTDAPELPECEQSFEIPQDEMQADFNISIDQIRAVTLDQTLGKTVIGSPKHSISNDICNDLSSNVTVVESSKTASSKFVIDLSLSINETGRNVLETKSPKCPSPSIYLPERDYNCLTKTNRELLTDMDTDKTKQKQNALEDIVDFSVCVNKNEVSDPFSDLLLNQNGPSSLSSKSFTGSLNDIHTGSIKESQKVPKLIRQRSYTLLNPSPQLLAHLEVQSLNTGVEMSCISMSESLSNLNSPGKKRRSWDLESAKVKWSSMAMELKQKNLQNTIIKTNNVNKVHLATPPTKKVPQVSPPSRARSVLSEKTKFSSSTHKPLPKSEPLQKTKKTHSPVRNALSNRVIGKEMAQPKALIQKKGYDSSKPASQLISESEDPATRVRELYEKIQKQQLIQMAGLVEKQKREQMLLHQVFEEQNNLLYKQLKTICPKSPIEAKEAWCDKHQEVDRGPVSLSQLINHKSPDQSIYDTSVSSTLTDTNNYINQCDNVLKKSRDISGSIKKQQMKTRSLNGTKLQSPMSQVEGSLTRTHSPNLRNTTTSRKLNYDTSASSDREYDPISTDRTNDTMADLNVTFPSDHSEECRSFNHNNPVLSHLYGKEVNVIHASPLQSASMHCKSTDSAIKNMEKTIQNSINNSIRSVKQSSMTTQPTPKQRAAATKIVAYAKGYLVRRLMRTDRVQATVQTIKDALLCALQLHQDREGIRGADVDLHRRLIQQITAACYSLHDTFVASSPAERCALVAADRARRRSLAARPPPKPFKQTDIMSQSYSGAFPARAKRSPAPTTSLMTQSNYETFSGDKSSVSRSRYMPSPRRRPWR